MNRPYIIGVTGGSASGKTIFLERLVKSFEKSEVCVISQDNYYRPKSLQPLDDEGIPNFDTPFSIDPDLFVADLNKLKEGREVTRSKYTFNNPAGKIEMLTFLPAPIIIVEGIFVFYYQDLANLFDLKVFVDAREFIKLSRRIRRDNEERGYTVEDVLYRYEKHVAPTYEKYIKPFKYDADLVIPNNQGFDNALAVLETFLKGKLTGIC